jgi:hypothetical protein
MSAIVPQPGISAALLRRAEPNRAGLLGISNDVRHLELVTGFGLIVSAVHYFLCDGIKASSKHQRTVQTRPDIVEVLSEEVNEFSNGYCIRQPNADNMR